MNIRDLKVIAPNIARRLSGVTATVVALVPAQAEHISICTTGRGIPAHLPYVPLWKLAFLPRDRWRVWHARRNVEMMTGIILKRLFRRKLKLVFTSSSPRKRTGLTMWMVAQMDAIVATNELNASVMPGNPVIIPHGVDTEVFSPTGEALFGSQPPKRIGCFGRIRPKKGTDVFVEAMCQILPSNEDWEGVVMGRATKENETFLKSLKDRVQAAGLQDRIRFEDEVDLGQMPKAYRGIDIYAATSLYEGFGLTPLEAMACGTPVVASKGVGTFDDQLADGEIGTLVPPGNADALARALGDLIQDEGRLGALRDGALAHVRERFSIEREARALVDLYNSLLSA